MTFDVGILGELFVRGCSECPFLRRVDSAAVNNPARCVLADFEAVDRVHLEDGAEVPAFCPLVEHAGSVRVTLYRNRPRPSGA